MLDTNQYIIKRLKQQPRIGMADIDDLGKNFKDMFGPDANLVRGAQQVTAQMQTLADQMYKLADGTRFLEDRNKDLRDTFGMTINQATALGGILDKNAKSFGVGGEKLREYTKNLKGLIGNFATVNSLINTDYGKQLYKTQQLITNNLKLTGDQANKYIGFVAGTSKGLNEQLLIQGNIAKEIEKQTGMTGVFKDITEDIAGLSEDVQMQYGRIPGSLALAVTKAKALGLNMADLKNTADNLLDIESSIGQELEYQLISGRRLTDTSGKSLTNAYREAALQGDASKQADIMNQILEQEGDTLQNNLFARKQMSEMLGMDEAALSRALQKKSILEKLPGGDSLFDLTGDALTSAVSQMENLSDAEKEAAIKQLEESQDARTTDEKVADVLNLMTTEGISAIIKNPEALQQRIAEGTVGLMKGTAQSLAPSATEGLARAAGTAVTVATNVANISAGVVKLLDPNTYKTLVTQQTPKTYGDAAGLADGGVIPAGYPNDSFPAMLTSGETVTPAGGFDQFAAAIVAAINSQTRALTDNKFGGGMNAPYYG
jgi:hypothetical protein